MKIEIDDEAFSRIYSHKSHPFPVKPGQKIAVRIVSQFGEETTKDEGFGSKISLPDRYSF